jgi:hypothetical protein
MACFYYSSVVVGCTAEHQNDGQITTRGGKKTEKKKILSLVKTGWLVHL